MRYIIYFLFFLPCVCVAQSETSDFITKDTLWKSGSTNIMYTVRYPRNYDTPNHPDTASRVLFISRGGAGENSTDTTALKANNRKFFHFYAMANQGWNGGIVCGNGTHYPIIVSWNTSDANIRPNKVLPFLAFIQSRYHIKVVNGVSQTAMFGFSEGAFTIGRFICYSPTSGDPELPLKMVKAIVQLQGNSDACCMTGFSGAGLSSVNRGITESYGIWYEKYGGSFMGFEGVTDNRGTYNPANAMRTRALSLGTPNRAYFTYEKIGYVSGGRNHCCWNEMSDPRKKDWICFPTGSVTNTSDIGFNGTAGQDNRNGNYYKGLSLDDWAYRQLDTSIVGGVPGAAVANAGPDQNLTTAVTTAAINGSGSSNATGYLWSVLSGPGGATFTSATSANTNINGLVQGVYVLNLAATDGTTTSNDQMTISVVVASNIAPSVNTGADQFINFPIDSVRVTATAADADGTIASYAWTKLSGGQATIKTPTSASTDITGLAPDVYVFRCTVTDNQGGIKSDDITIVVNDQEVIGPKKINIDFGRLVLTKLPSWNAFNVDLKPDFNTGLLKNEDGTISPISLNFKFSGGTASNSLLDYTMTDDTVCLSIASSNVPMVGTFIGMDDSKKYKFDFYCTRSNATITLQDITIGNTTITDSTQMNTDRKMTISEVRSAGGVVTFTITKRTGTLVYLAGLTVTEDGAANANQPPVVTTGGDVAISTSPGSTTLTPTVVDEGTVTYQWIQLSGPMAAVINTPTAKNTSITGMTAPGTYRFRISATDEQGLIGSSEQNVVANAPGNSAPAVDAGSNQIITLPTNTVTLSGTTTDADGTIASRTWTKLPGQAGGDIVSPSSNSTVINNLQEGNYTFRLTAVDNLGATTFDDVTISVLPVPQPGAWPGYWQVGTGEYQDGYISPNGTLYASGNKTNIGFNNVGTNGVPRKVIVTPSTLKFKLAVGGLHTQGAIDTAGYVWMLGDNDGNYGNNSLVGNFVANKILTDITGSAFNGVTTMASSYYRTNGNGFNCWYAVKDGDLYGWGAMLGGMRGNGTDSIAADTMVWRPTKIDMPGGRKVKQVVAGSHVVALCTDGTVWTWGAASYQNLGYAGTGTDKQTPHQLTTLAGITQIAGAASFNYALRADGVLYGWGAYGDYMGIANGLPIAVPTVLTNIMNGLPAKIKTIKINTVSSAAILEDGRLYLWGDGAQGTIGNGKHEASEAWDFGRANVQQLLPYWVMPGLTFDDISGSQTYTFHWVATSTNGKMYAWGKNKANVIPNRIVIASSQINASFGNLADVPWPQEIEDFNNYATDSAIYVSTSRFCIANPSGSPCNGYSNPANTKPTASAGSTQNLGSVTSTTLNGSASTDNVHISYYEWSQVSGPNTAILSLPGVKQCPVWGLVTGVYVFKLKVTDNGWLSDSSTVTINVDQTSNQLPIITISADVTVTLPTNSATVTGSAIDNDGTIASYLWEKVSGPSGGTIDNPSYPSTGLSGLAEGTYVYRFTATDNVGATTSKTMQVVVQVARNPYESFRIIIKI